MLGQRRSTVDAAARDGDMRSRQVQHAHNTLSFQLSGAQLGITITALLTGYLAEPALAHLFEPALRPLAKPATVTVIILSLIGVGLHSIISFLQRRVVFWMDTGNDRVRFYYATRL